MDPKRIFSFLKKSNTPPPLQHILLDFMQNYLRILEERGENMEKGVSWLSTFTSLIEEEIRNPTSFPLYHRRIDKPFDYYDFGIEMLRPLVLFEKSTVRGLDIVEEIISHLKNQENVILLSNHQTEPDPQAISLLLDKLYPTFAKEIIFIAGHRVTTDPLAIPFSKGRNLICIYSKKRIDIPPEEKEKKLQHNQKAMQTLTELLSQGGKCIFVAPSGGRDRPLAHDALEVAPFDPQSVEMFRLIALKAKTKTHFYPLALSTYNLLPPPLSVEEALGEARIPSTTAIHIAFGKKIDFETIDDPLLSKEDLRKARARYAWNQVNALYNQFPKDL